MTAFARLVIAESIDADPVPADVRVPSADVAHVEVDRFGIDDARALIRTAATRPAEHPTRSFVLCCKGLTNEAQNALLKLFEEPPEHARFFLVIPHESRLIPTLRSRFVLVERSEPSAVTEEARSFLSASYAERLSVIASLHTKKDAIGMETLARNVIACITANGESSALAAAATVDRYIGVRGGSKKMLLEHLAVHAPHMAC